MERDDDAHGGSRASRIFSLVTTFLAVGGVILTIWTVGPAALYGELRAIGVWFAVIFALELAQTACDAAALRDFLGLSQRNRLVPYFAVVRAQTAGRAINLVTPLGSIGEGTKATMLLRYAPTSRVVAGVVRTNVVSLLLSFTLVAIGAPVSALVLDLPAGISHALYIGGAIAAVAAVGLVLLVRRGLARTFAQIARGVRLLSRARRERWKTTLEDIDERLRSGARSKKLRARLRGGVGWVFLSRALGWLSMWVILFATGNTVGIGFMAVVVTAGVAISWVASIAPLGLGVTESANYGLFRALGEDPALGVVMVIARRVVTVAYVMVGLAVVAMTSRR